MKKIVKTYPDGCKWCNGVGFIKNPSFDPNISSSTLQNICPVCNGSKIITVTETYEPLYEVSIDPKFETTPIQIIRDRLHLDNTPSDKVVSTLFKARRLMNRLTLRELSKKTGISPSTIMRIENGNRCIADNYNTLLEFWKNYGTHS